VTSQQEPQYGADGASPAADRSGGQYAAPYGGDAPPPQGMPYGQPMHQPPPGAYPAPYGQPYGYGYPYVPPQRTTGMAIASMVLGILWLYWVGSILALVFGYIARNQIRERGEAGGGMATAGIVLGWIGVGFIGLAVVVGIAASV
jgi:hypothetical protein